MFLTNERLVFICSGAFAWLSLVISISLIHMHLKHFTQPVIQSKIIGILWMVPIYAVSSWFSIRFSSAAIYLSLIRDCYESYVLYLFLAMMLAYLGGGDEDTVAQIANRQPRVYHGPCLSLLCRNHPIPRDGHDFIQWCKLGCLQYALIKPITSFIAIILELTGCYHESSFNLEYGWIYITCIVNTSIAWSFYCLIHFYLLFVNSQLKLFNPLPKFILVKSVIFVSFWQSVALALMQYFGLLDALGGGNGKIVSIQLQNTLICFEMFIAAIAHWWTFGYKEYVKTADDVDDNDKQKREPLLSTSASLSTTLDKHFSHQTAIKDMNQVIPGAKFLSGAKISDAERNKQTYLPLVDMSRNVDEVDV